VSAPRPAAPESAGRRRALAFLIGFLCHGSFLAAVTAMLVGLWSGLALGCGVLAGAWAWVANAALALQFPLLHSFLLTDRGRRLLARAVGRRHGGTLAPTTYAWSAALQILATFLLWSPSGTVWWDPSGAARVAMGALYAGAWLFLGKALLDGGLGLQTGWIGWTALWRGERPRYPAMPEHGLFAACRQPIYLGFGLTLWTGPIWTPDRLLLAMIWSLYCVFGPLWKERRYVRMHGQAFEAYRRRVPYMFPFRRRAA
jgi:protein-S-isoprenylcysteine O-methyltransferase Ste14